MKPRRSQVSLILGVALTSIVCHADAITEEDMPTREELRKYDDLIGSYELSHQDLDTLKLTMSAPANRLIAPENIKSLNLGSPIFTSSSTFDYGSIFDGGMLNKAGLINTLDGDSKVRSEVQVTANTRKTFDTSQVKGSGQLAVQWGGLRSNGGYLHENATQKSQLSGEITANAYQYLTKQISLRLNNGSDPIEMSQYTRGTPFDIKELGKYITVTPMAIADICLYLPACEQYTKITVNSVYEGKGQDNPRAHLEVLALLEGYFDKLAGQYGKYSGNAKVSKSSLDDMRSLRKSINQSIQAFYDKYGDSFTSKLYGYNQVRASAKMIKNEKAENSESNNALSIGLAYGNFVGGIQSQVDVQWYKKKAFEENRNSLTVKAEAEPASDVNLSAWEDKVLKFLKEVNPTLSVPSDVVTKQGVPSLPQPAELRYDPTMPPGVTLAKYDDYKQVESDFNKKYDDKAAAWKERGAAIKNFITRRKNNAGNDGRDSVGSAITDIEDNSSVGLLFKGAIKKVNGGIGIKDSLHDSIISNGSSVSNVQTAALTSLLSKSSDSQSVSPSRKEKELRRELKLLRAEGRRDYIKNHLNAKMTAAQVQRILRQQVRTDSGSALTSLGSMGKTAQSSGAESQFVGLANTVIAGFDVEPYAAHLAVLRPKLEVPGDPNPIDGFSGFPNVYDLAMLVHNYEIIDTYLSFISRFEISGLKNRAIAANYSKFFAGDKISGYKGLQDRALDLIEVALASGKDIPSSELSALLDSLIFGADINGVSDYKNTELFRLLGNDAFNYVMSLLDQRVSADGKWSNTEERRLDIIRRAPGGYIPVKLDASNNPSFVSTTKANKTPEDGLFGGDWIIKTDSIPLESGFDLSRLYSQRNQSPLYPVFTYNDKNTTSLLFMQFSGSSTLVYGRTHSLYPNFDCNTIDLFEQCGSLTSIETILPTVQDSETYNQMRRPENGFDIRNLSFGFSLIYPKASDEDNRINALRNGALLVGLDGNSVPVPDAKPNRYALGPTTTLLDAFRTEGKAEMADTYDALDYDFSGNDKVSTFTRVDLRTAQNLGSANWGFMVLLPVDSQLLTEGRFDSLFTYSNDTTPAAVYGQRPDGRSGLNGGILRAMLR